MGSIYELLLKIPAPMGVAIGCQAKLPVIMSFGDITHNLQMAYYWWRDADIYMHKLNVNEEVLEVGEAEAKTVVIPTMIGLVEQMEFISRELTSLAAETQKYMEEQALPPVAQYKLEQGYNRVMEALYSNEMSKTYYEQYTRAIKEQGHH